MKAKRNNKLFACMHLIILKGLKILDNIEFGKYIAELREKAGYETQAALGKAAGIESSTLSRIETGDTKNPSVSTLKKIAPLLGVAIEEIMEKLGYIMTKTKEIAGIFPDEKDGMLEVFLNSDNDNIQLFERINRLTPASKATVLALVDNLEKIDAQLVKESEKEA
jgi:transcriptional regulator with XRE-family HTH domain